MMRVVRVWARVRRRVGIIRCRPGWAGVAAGCCAGGGGVVVFQCGNSRLLKGFVVYDRPVGVVTVMVASGFWRSVQPSQNVLTKWCNLDSPRPWRHQL